MTRSMPSALAVVLAIAISSPALAAPAAKPAAPAAPAAAPVARPDLSLADVVLLARDNSLGAQLNRRKLASSVASRQVTVSSAYPSLELQTQAQYSKLPPGPIAELFGQMGAGGGGIPGFPAPGVVVDNTIQASQVLFDAFRTRDAIAIADIQNDIARLSVTQAEQDAMANAAAAYFNVLRAQGLTDVASNTVKQAQEHLRLGDVRLRAGTGTKAEVLQLRAQLANAQQQYTQARTGATLARLQLSNAVNAPVRDRRLDPDPGVPSLQVAAQGSMDEGLSRRTEIQQLQLGEKIDETRVSLESRALWPTVAAVGRYAQRGFSQGMFTAGLGLNWTLFDGFKVRAKIEQARADAEAAKVQMEQLRQNIALEINQQFETREEARARIVTAREGLASAQEAYRLAVHRFEVGMAAPSELTDVQNTLVQAGNNYVQAVNDLRMAELKLAKALGVDLAAYLAPGQGAPSPAPAK